MSPGIIADQRKIEMSCVIVMGTVVFGSQSICSCFFLVIASRMMYTWMECSAWSKMGRGAWLMCVARIPDKPLVESVLLPLWCLDAIIFSLLFPAFISSLPL